jgi:hypothetical protein
MADGGLEGMGGKAMSIQPPLHEEHGPAPSGVCSRWMGDSPCGAAGTHHVIWDSEMTNGCVCATHTDEIRRNWVYLGLHSYSAACASPGIAIWIEAEDRCVMPGDDRAAPVAGMARTETPAAAW